MPAPDLHPNANVSVQCGKFPGTRANWDCVDETTPDDTDYVYSATVAEKKDLYAIPSPSVPANSDIISVEVFWRARYVTELGYGRPRVGVPGQSVSEGTLQTLTASWVNRSQKWMTNPQTGNPWTVDEVNTLGIGVGLQVIYGEGEQAQCSQVYVIIKYNRFGNDTAETTTRGCGSTEHTACRFPVPGSGEVELDSITLYCASSSGTINVEAAVYDDDAVNQKPNNRKGAVTNTVEVTTTFAWRTFTWSSKPKITRGADHWIALRPQSAVAYIKVNTSGGTNQDRQAAGGSLPDPWGAAGTGNTFKHSAYVDYTPVAEEEEADTIKAQVI